MPGDLVGLAVAVHFLMVMVTVMAEVFIQMVWVDRYLHDVQLFPIGFDNKQAHPLTFRMNEDQSLLSAAAAGLADDPLPALAQLLLDHLVQFISIQWRVEMLELRNVQVAHAAVGGLARDQADEAHEGNVRGMHVIPVLDGVDHAVEAALSATGQHHDRNQQQHEAYGNEQEPSHQSPPFLSLSLPWGVCCTPPSAPRPLRPCSLLRSSMRMGPRMRTMVSSLG